MGTIATLLGLQPAPVERCRVLELGCATGTNLIAMACGLPDAELVGIDASGRQIADARGTVADLGLRNVRFEHRDLRAVDPDFGPFDYIIAHGLYSWVPPPVQDRLLAVCRQNLAPAGVAFVSYNTYPGWNMLGSVRDMMLYRTRHLTNPWERAEQAKRFVDFLAQAVPPESGPFGLFLQAYVRDLAERWELVDELAASSLLHDELEAVNEPVYFHQFAGRAGRHGLQYLAEANLRAVIPTRFPPGVVEFVRDAARDIVESEQYLDFLRNRSFRQSLLVHQEAQVRRRFDPDPRRFARMYVSSQARPDRQEDRESGAVFRFRAPDGAVLATDHPVTRAALQHAAEMFPEPVRFPELLARAKEPVAADEVGDRPSGGNEETADQDARALVSNLLQGFTYSAGLVELSVHRPPFASRVEERPEANVFARYLVARGGAVVTNARHERIQLDPVGRHLVDLLDGSRDLSSLEALVQDAVSAGELELPERNEEEGSSLGRDVAVVVRRQLGWLVRAALLR